MPKYEPCANKGCPVVTSNKIVLAETGEEIPVCCACASNNKVVVEDGHLRFLPCAQSALERHESMFDVNVFH